MSTFVFIPKEHILVLFESSATVTRCCTPKCTLLAIDVIFTINFTTTHCIHVFTVNANA